MRYFTVLSRTRLKRVPVLPQLFDALLYVGTVACFPKRRAAMDRVERALLSWPAVAAHTHPFGGTEFRVGGAEIAHLHGSGVLDFPFPLSVKRELFRAGRVLEHHSHPRTGWATFVIRTEDDVPEALSLLWLRHQDLTQKRPSPSSGEGQKVGSV